MNGTQKIKVTMEIEVTDQDIDDMMVTALEGGITPWCSEAEVVGEYLGQYASEQISRGGKLILHDAESDDKWELDKTKFLNGLTRWIQNSSNMMCAVDDDGRIDAGNIDAGDIDEIIQIAVMGEVVFG